MDFEIPDEQAELKASVRGVLERESPLTLAREVTEQGAPARPAVAERGRARALIL
jgi:hypothetical protein